jgi:ribosomal 50S subunit-associated protein YjgA (DUF615 family)
VDEILRALATFGPYSAPINIVLAAGLTWLAKDRARILEELAAAQLDAKELREQRVEDLREQADEYREHSKATQEALHRWSEIMTRMIDRRGGP